MARNDFENLQSVYLRTYNPIVRESFRSDIPDNDISTPEGQMKAACLMKDTDNAVTMLLRMNLFYFVREDAKRLHPPLYTLPVLEVHEEVRFRPQIVFHFEESRQDARENDRRPKTVRASFRLMNETTSTVTQVQVNQFQSRIRAQFPRTYAFKTGRIKLSYRDPANGFQLIIAPYSEAEGRDLITKLLAVAGTTPNWENLTLSRYPNRNFFRDEHVTVLGQRRRLPRRRMIAEVRLRKAELHLHGQLEAVSLFDTP